MPDTWEALEHDCKNCRECSLWETRTNVVFGVGNPLSLIHISDPTRH